jgi:hypothetical protein
MINRKNLRDDDEDDILAAQEDFLQQLGVSPHCKREA